MTGARSQQSLIEEARGREWEVVAVYGIVFCLAVTRSARSGNQHDGEPQICDLHEAPDSEGRRRLCSDSALYVHVSVTCSITEYGATSWS